MGAIGYRWIIAFPCGCISIVDLSAEAFPWGLCCIRHNWEVVEDVLAIVWVKADKKNIQIKKNIHSKLDEVIAEDFQIQRLLTNLFVNAIKYSPATCFCEACCGGVFYNFMKKYHYYLLKRLNLLYSH